MKFDYIIYHKKCLDGFSGLVVFTLTDKYSEDAFIYPDMPSAKTVPPNIKGKTVIIIDVAYKKEILEKIFNSANFVLFIDHHETIRDDVLKLEHSKHEIIYDIKMSGASLVWQYFFPNQTPPRFIKYVADNDTGTWNYDNSIPFVKALAIRYNFSHSMENFDKWKKLLDSKKVDKLIKIGNIYLEYEKSLIETNAKRYTILRFPSHRIYNDFRSYYGSVGQYRVAVINSYGCPSPSSVSKKIIDDTDCNFCIFWTLHIDKKEYVLSLRGNDTNVGLIAQSFGGGGHRLAAACSIDSRKYNITDLFISNS